MYMTEKGPALSDTSAAFTRVFTVGANVGSPEGRKIENAEEGKEGERGKRGEQGKGDVRRGGEGQNDMYKETGRIKQGYQRKIQKILIGARQRYYNERM